MPDGLVAYSQQPNVRTDAGKKGYCPGAEDIGWQFVNLQLIYESELVSDSRAKVTGSRVRDLIERRDMCPGVEVQVGVENGLIGTAQIETVSSDFVELSLSLERKPPPKKEIIAVVAVPRPQTVKKLIHLACTLGLKQLHLVRSMNSQKSYLYSNALQKEAIQTELRKGLEQAVDTVAPFIEVHTLFRPFVGDRLSSIAASLPEPQSRLIADTQSTTQLREIFSTRSFYPSSTVVAIGAETGWSSYEIEQFQKGGFLSVSLGDRILRVETALTVLVGGIDNSV